jgi:hypothetical protein
MGALDVLAGGGNEPQEEIVFRVIGVIGVIDQAQMQLGFREADGFQRRGCSERERHWVWLVEREMAGSSPATTIYFCSSYAGLTRVSGKRDHRVKPGDDD